MSHDSIFRGSRRGVCKIKKILSETGQRSQIPLNVSFRINQHFSLESQKSPNLTHGTQESQTVSQKLFAEKSKSQSCKW